MKQKLLWLLAFIFLGAPQVSAFEFMFTFGSTGSNKGCPAGQCIFSLSEQFNLGESLVLARDRVFSNLNETVNYAESIVLARDRVFDSQNETFNLAENLTFQKIKIFSGQNETFNLGENITFISRVNNQNSFEAGGTDEYLSASDDNNIDYAHNAELFLDCYAKFDATGSQEGILNKWASTTGYQLFKDSSDKVRVEFADGTNTIYAVSTTALSANTYYRITVTKGTGTDKDAIKIYLDETSETISADSGATALSATMANAAAIEIGRDATPNYLTGHVDWCVIGGDELSQSEINEGAIATVGDNLLDPRDATYAANVDAFWPIGERNDDLTGTTGTVEEIINGIDLTPQATESGDKSSDVPTTYDSDAQAYFDALTNPPDTTFKTCWNDFVVTAKSNSWWSKIDRIFPLPKYSGVTLTDSAVCAKSLNSLTWVNSPTLNASGTVTFDGSTNYADVGIDPDSATNYDSSAPDGMLAIYNLTSGSIGSWGTFIGTNYSGAFKRNHINQYDSTPGEYESRMFNTGFRSKSNDTGDNDGFIVVRRISTTSLKFYKNGVEDSEDTSTVTLSSDNINFHLGVRSDLSEYGAYELGFVYIGASIDDSDQAAFNTAVEDYQDCLSRGVQP